MTLGKAMQLARSNGMAIRKTDGEYRVNYMGGTEETAYYTDDLADAVETMEQMAQQKVEQDHERGTERYLSERGY